MADDTAGNRADRAEGNAGQYAGQRASQSGGQRAGQSAGQQAGQYGGATRAAGGLLTGVAAGVIMALVAMVHTFLFGLGFWLPMKLVAALYFGVGALIGGAGTVIAGILTHLAVAGAIGLVFGWALGNWIHKASGLAAGILTGVAIWALNTFVLLTWINPTMLDREMMGAGWWFVYHLVFGGLLLFTAPVIGALERWRARR